MLSYSSDLPLTAVKMSTLDDIKAMLVAVGALMTGAERKVMLRNWRHLAFSTPMVMSNGTIASYSNRKWHMLMSSGHTVLLGL